MAERNGEATEKQGPLPNIIAFFGLHRNLVELGEKMGSRFLPISPFQWFQLVIVIGFFAFSAFAVFEKWSG